MAHLANGFWAVSARFIAQAAPDFNVVEAQVPREGRAYTLAVPRTAGGERLASRVIAADPPGPRALYVLHGIYGHGRNWAAVARHLCVRRADWRAVLLDLRLHGESPPFDPPHTVLACAGDVLEYEATSDAPPRAVLGHSFGGKVALAVAARAGIDPLQVWVIDSTPEARTPDGAAWEMLRVIGALPATFESRHDAVLAMEARGVRPAVAAWMATNLGPAGGGYAWRLDFGAMQALLDDFFRTDLWDVVEHPPSGAEIHFVKATESRTLTDAACARLLEAGRHNGQVHLHHVRGGHWLNTDNPEAVLSLLQARLPHS
jgi:pimeloyl-ACP methyl ester carboxylesterase